MPSGCVWCVALVLSLISVAAPALAATDNDARASSETEPTAASDNTGGGTIGLNPNPTRFDAGPLGEISISGALTGYGLFQSNAFADDRARRVDVGNLQLIIQKTEGPLQIFVQAGIYAIPSLGAPNSNTLDTTLVRNFGPLPLAFVTIDLGDGFSVAAGQLNSVFGGESTFTYQNLNIVRGLLFNQSNSISRGAQLSYEKGDLSVSASVTDGFYSGRLTWFLGAIAYKLNNDSKLSFSAGTNFAPSADESPAAPLLQNSQSMYNIGYSYTSGPWTLTPFVQYTHVSRDVSIGIPENASTSGAAFLANYAFTDNFSLSGRAEYIRQSGNREAGQVSLLYGPGSRAYSVTVTPTWREGRFFARAEYSYLGALEITPGLAFGRTGNKKTQSIFAIETGILF